MIRIDKKNNSTWSCYYNKSKILCDFEIKIDLLIHAKRLNLVILYLNQSSLLNLE